MNERADPISCAGSGRRDDGDAKSAGHIGLRGEPCQCTPARRRKMLNFRVCLCHGLKHAQCPDAAPCIGGCGRKTTPSETSAPGYCSHCAADQRWIKVA